MKLSLLLVIIILLHKTVASSLTKSYVRFLYKKYGESIDSFWNLLIEDHEIRSIETTNWKGLVKILYSEFVFMQLQELQASVVVEIGDPGLMSSWIINALNKNAIRSGKETRLVIVNDDTQITNISKWTPFLNERVAIEIANWAHLSDQSTPKEDLIAICDSVVVSNHLLHGYSVLLVNEFIKHIINRRHDSLPAFGLFFLNEDKDKDGKSSEQRLSVISKWVKGILSLQPVDYQTFSTLPTTNDSTSTLWTLAIMRHNEGRVLAKTHNSIKEKNSPNMASVGSSQEIDAEIGGARLDVGFSVATVLKAPRLTIVTPCSRHQHLQKIVNSIQFNFVKEWIVVYDYSKAPQNYFHENREPIHQRNNSILYRFNPKIVEIYRDETVLGNFGNPERNMGIYHIQRRPLKDGGKRGGIVYFLDDDNIIHLNTWTLSQTMKVQDLLLYAELSCYITVEETMTTPIDPPSCQFLKTETGMALIPVDMIISESKTILWNIDEHAADGMFLQDLCEAFPQNKSIKEVVGTYHNGVDLGCAKLIDSEVFESPLDVVHNWYD